MRRTSGAMIVLVLSMSVMSAVPASADTVSQLHVVQAQPNTSYGGNDDTITQCTSQQANQMTFTSSRANVQLTPTQQTLLPGVADWGLGTVTITGSASAGALSNQLHFGPGDVLDGSVPGVLGTPIPFASLGSAEVHLTLQSAAGHADVTLQLSPRGGIMQCADWNGADSTPIGGTNPSTGWWASAQGYMTFDAKVYPSSPASGQAIEETGTGWFDAQQSHNNWSNGGSTSSGMTVILDTNGSTTMALDTAPPTVTGTPDRAPNAHGWYNAPVTISWSAIDDITPASQLTIPPSTNLDTEGANQIVTSAPVCDTAGNCATGATTVSLDETAPSIIGSADRAPNPAGWYNAPVTVSFACTDALSGVATCPPSVTVSSDGKAQVVTGQAADNAGNTASTPVTVSVDQAAPTVSTPSFAANPVSATQPTTITATASDALSGVVGGEMWIGTDPGQGQATPMTLAGQTLSSTVPRLSPGIYTVGVRSLDAAGNWSTTQTALLVVYDPTGGFATGGGWIIPGGPTSDAGDQLPGLDGGSKANFGFIVRYQNGQSTVPTGNFQFHYNAGKFHLTSTGYNWLVVTNSQWAHFQGQAAIDGSTATYPIQIDARDSSATGQADRLVLKVYAPGANPAAATPIYQATGDVTGGAITIHRN